MESGLGREVSRKEVYEGIVEELDVNCMEALWGRDMALVSRFFSYLK